LDAAGLFILPGGIDPHVHLAAPFMGGTADGWVEGTAAGLAGGTTTVIHHVLPGPGDDREEIEAHLASAAALAGAGARGDYGFHVAVTAWTPRVAEAMARLVKNDGIASFKFFLAYKNILNLAGGDADLLAALRHCAALRALPLVHAEHPDLIESGAAAVWEAGIAGPEGHALSRPPSVETAGTTAALALAREAGAPLYVVHVQAAGAAAAVEAARTTHGQTVIGEAIAAGFAVPGEDGVFHKNWTVAAAHVMSPPIRSPAHQAALVRALAGGALDLVGTDHCAYTASQKRGGDGSPGLTDFRAIPNGVTGLEERLVATWDAVCAGGDTPPSRCVQLTSTAAARTFGLFPRKGAIAPGSDADVVLFDPAANTTFSASSGQSAVDVSVWEGRTLRGRVVATVAGGRLAWDGASRTLAARPGDGRRLALSAAAHYDGAGEAWVKQWRAREVGGGRAAPVDRSAWAAAEERRRTGGGGPRDEL
jgi:dihydropyrimidinase